MYALITTVGELGFVVANDLIQAQDRVFDRIAKQCELQGLVRRVSAAVASVAGARNQGGRYERTASSPRSLITQLQQPSRVVRTGRRNGERWRPTASSRNSSLWTIASDFSC
jgi:hypothetical protein